MLRDVVLVSAALLLPALLWSAEPGRCQLTRGLYEDRLILLQKQGPAEEQAAGALLAGGKAAAGSKLSAIESEYGGFFAELTSATQSKDSVALKACCDRATNDRAGALVCRLALYLDGGRKESAPFMEQFPANRKEFTLLSELNSLSGAAGAKLFPPKGPGYQLIDELFLLAMDQRDVAITKYFNLAN